MRRAARVRKQRNGLLLGLPRDTILRANPTGSAVALVDADLLK